MADVPMMGGGSLAPPYPMGVPPAQAYDQAGLDRSTGASAAMMRMLFPGLFNYFTQGMPAPSMQPNAAGKVTPTDYNPNTGPALQDVSNMAMSAVPAGLGMGLASKALPMAADTAGNLAPSATRSVMSSLYDMAGLGGGAAAVGMPSSANAAEGRPQIMPDEADQVSQLKKEIAGLAAQRIKATKDLGPKGAAIQAATYDTQIAQRNQQIDGIIQQVSSRQNAYDKQQQDYAQATQPLTVRYPGEVAAARTGAMGLSAGTGLMHGLAHKPGIWPWLGSALLGGAEGSAGILAPNAIDLGQPAGTGARDAAEKNLSFISHPASPGSWDYAQNVVAPDAALGALAGIMGHGVGHGLSSATSAVTGGVRSLFGGAPSTPTPPPTPAPQTLASGLLPAAAPSGKVWPSDPSQINMAKDVNGNWYEKGTGHKIPKPLWPAENVVKMRK